MPFHGLRFKINAAITATCLFVALLFGAMVYPYEMNRRAARFGEIRTLVSAVFEQRREEIANEIYARQSAALASSLNSIKAVEGIAMVRVYGTGGQLIAATHPDLQGLAPQPQAPPGPEGLERRTLADRPFAVYAAPIQVIGERVGDIRLYYDLSPERRLERSTIAMSVLLLVSVLVVISLVLNNLLTRFVLRPTFLLRNAIARMQGGNLGAQVPLVSQDEIGEVAAAFNRMSSMLVQQREALLELNAGLESSVQERTSELMDSNRRLQEEIRERIRAEAARRELEERLARSRKMEALGLLAGGVGHDLNNVLSGVVSYPDFLLMGMADDHPLRKAITTIRDSGLKAAAIVQDLLALARRGVMQTCVLDLNQDIVQDYLVSPEYASLGAQHPGIRMELRLEPGLLRIQGSPVHLKKSLMNLVINAMEAQPQGGRIRISTANVRPDPPLEGGDWVRLRVEDDGVGISAEDLQRIFEPFYTRKVMGRSGTGLGMAVVWGTVQDHHGTVSVHSVPGQGASFDLSFPATLEEVAPAAGSVPVAEYQGRGEHILVVDDLEEQRALVSAILLQLNYRVDTAPSGEAAVAYLRTGSADLVLLDMIMDPGMDGLDTYQELVRLHPGQKAIIASGFAESERVEAAIGLGVSCYLKKPYTIQNLGQALRSELGRDG